MHRPWSTRKQTNKQTNQHGRTARAHTQPREYACKRARVRVHACVYARLQQRDTMRPWGANHACLCRVGGTRGGCAGHTPAWSLYCCCGAQRGLAGGLRSLPGTRLTTQYVRLCCPRPPMIGDGRVQRMRRSAGAAGRTDGASASPTVGASAGDGCMRTEWALQVRGRLRGARHGRLAALVLPASVRSSVRPHRPTRTSRTRARMRARVSGPQPTPLARPRAGGRHGCDAQPRARNAGEVAARACAGRYYRTFASLPAGVSAQNASECDHTVRGRPGRRVHPSQSAALPPRERVRVQAQMRAVARADVGPVPAQMWGQSRRRCGASSGADVGPVPAQMWAGWGPGVRLSGERRSRLTAAQKSAV